MESDRQAGGGSAFWIPGGAVLLSLLVSTWALQREPFINLRPNSTPPALATPIDARLWQDPFDAIERYRAQLKSDDKITPNDPCPRTIPASSIRHVGSEPSVKPDQSASNIQKEATAEPPGIMVAVVRGSPYADEVELRRRIRYAILAGFKSSRMVPDDEDHIGCLNVPMTDHESVDMPFESFSADPFDPPQNIEDVPTKNARTFLFWVKEEALGERPLAQLNWVRQYLNYSLVGIAREAGPTIGMAMTVKQDGTDVRANTTQAYPVGQPGTDTPGSLAEVQPVLKVIGPASSQTLRKMYLEEADMRRKKGSPSWKGVEIYSPLATAEWSMLTRGSVVLTENDKLAQPASMQLLRTVSDDGTMASLLLEELALRHVNPALGIQCARKPTFTPATDCPAGRWEKSNRVAILAEWDSFYSRALIESFIGQVANRARFYPPSTSDGDGKPLMTPLERREVGQWVMSFGYLRGVDGRLPDKTSTPAKASGDDEKKQSQQPTLETADGNGQLDYLRRLADHIADLDEAQRKAGENGFGAIGVFGQDTYDKLLALQALKSRMPTKVFFSTDLDARMLQQGQMKVTRNLVLAAPYGLTLTRALQQDVPPFRESLQSSVYIAVMAALSPQPLAAKRLMFDYSKSSLLSPAIYEVGKSGFIQLASSLTNRQSKECAVGSVSTKGEQIRAQDIMALRCLQDPSPPPYLEASPKMPEWLGQAQSFFWAGPLCIVLVVIGIVLGWTHTDPRLGDQRRGWAQRVPLILYGAAALSGWAATLYWRVEILWLAGALVFLGMLSASLNRHQLRRQRQADPASEEALGAEDASGHGEQGAAWYVIVPAIIFILLLLAGYQDRDELTEKGLGEPMFLFEGISSWPTVALRLLAAVISLAALAWAWRKLSRNRREIEQAYCLSPVHPPQPLWQQWTQWSRDNALDHKGRWRMLGQVLYRVLLPLADRNDGSLDRDDERLRAIPNSEDKRTPRLLLNLWIEHRIAGNLGARMLRVLLFTWVFLVVTSALYVVVPVEDIPIRGHAGGIWLWSWVLPTVSFQILVFWVMDANLLLSRFIKQLSRYRLIWPTDVQERRRALPIPPTHCCLDDYLVLSLIAKRTSAVNRLIYAPTLVMLVLMASRSTLFDNWPSPISSTIILVLNALLLLWSALKLRRCAERARSGALSRLDHYLLRGIDAPEQPAQINAAAVRETLIAFRERIRDLKTGAFSPYSEEPLLRAVLVSLTGLGGTVIVDALNFLTF